MHIKTFTFNPFQENTYLLYDHTKEGVLIDAGCLYPNEEQALQQFITEQGIVLKHLLNTHLHIDHVFGNAFVAQTCGILPEAHTADEFLLQTMPAQALLFGIHYPVKVQKLGNYLNEGDTISFGENTLQVLHVPGHSPGSLCFYAPENGILIAGDVLFQGSIGRTDLPGGDYGTLINGIQKKLLTLPPETVVYCGHGATTTIGEEKQYNPYL